MSSPLLWDVMKFAHKANISSKAVMIVTSFFMSDSFDTSCRDPFSMFQKRVIIDSLNACIVSNCISVDIRVMFLLEASKTIIIC
jgi:hypothetical protein